MTFHFGSLIKLSPDYIMKKKGIIAGIFILLTVLQGLFLVYFNRDPLRGDAINYYEISQNILTKGSSTLLGEPNVRRPPLYPFFLATIFYIFGNKVLFAQIAQIILISSTCFLIYFLGKLLFSEKAGVCAALLLSLHPVIIASSYPILTEGLSIFLVVLVAFVLTHAVIENNVKLVCLSGVFLGITTLVRPVLIFFPFFFTFLIFKRIVLGKRVRFIVALIVPFLIILSAWTVRNYARTKLFIPIALGGDLELWNGSYLPGRGYSDHPKTIERRDVLYQLFEWKSKESHEYRNSNKAEYYVYYLEMKEFRKDALKSVIEHPFEYIALFPEKVLRLYLGSYSFMFGIKEHFSDFFSSVHGRVINHYFLKLIMKLILIIFSTGLFILAAVGVCVNFSNSRFFVILSLLIYWTIFFLVFSPITRYSIPVIPLLILSAVGGTVTVFFKKRPQDNG